MAKKKTKKKKAAKKKTVSVLTGEQLRKVRKLVKSKDAANVKVAIQLLQSTEATSDDWSDVFSSRTISLMVNTWDLAVWNPVIAALSAYPSLQAEFYSLATDRIRRKGDDFIRSAVKNNFQELTPQLVRIVTTLAACRGCQRYLPTLSDVAAEVLSKQGGELNLNGLASLSDAVAERLGKHKGSLRLYGLTELSDAAAESLSKHRSTLWLNGLTSLSDTAAESLSKHKGSLHLGRLKSLSDAAAESLSKHEGGLELHGLTELSGAAAESLSKRENKFKSWQINLDNLPESAAKILRDAGHGE